MGSAITAILVAGTYCNGIFQRGILGNGGLTARAACHPSLGVTLRGLETLYDDDIT